MLELEEEERSPMCLPFHLPSPPPPPAPQRQNTARAPRRSRSPGLTIGHVPPDGWSEADFVPGPRTDSEFRFYVPSPAPCLYALIHHTAFSWLAFDPLPPGGWVSKFSNPREWARSSRSGLPRKRCTWAGPGKRPGQPLGQPSPVWALFLKIPPRPVSPSSH